MSITILQGDALSRLSKLPSDSVQCCVSSPPYWGLRNYGVEGQIGLDKTPEEYVAKIVSVFEEVRRVLKPDGTCWVNLGDSFSTGAGSIGRCPGGGDQGERFLREGMVATQPNRMPLPGLKPKDLIGIPWMVAFAMRSAGWYLRRDVIWGKPNGMPESVLDRPVSSHEYVFLFSKSERYFYDHEAVRLPALPESTKRLEQNIDAQLGSLRANGGSERPMKAGGRSTDKQRGHTRRHAGFNDRWDAMKKDEQQEGRSSLRSVWWLPTAQSKDAHFAVMPSALAAVCILAGSRTGDTILDPFGGSGTTGQVALELGRSAILIELNPEYLPLIERRTNVTPGLALK